jgi:hypothetical protein
MTRDELLELLARLRCAPVGRARLRAPHKPLLLMWLFGKFAATGSSAAAYAEAEEPVSTLINDFGPAVASAAAARRRAAMPFIHLEREIWDLRDASGAEIGPRVPESGVHSAVTQARSQVPQFGHGQSQQRTRSRSAAENARQDFPRGLSPTQAAAGAARTKPAAAGTCSVSGDRAAPQPPLQIVKRSGCVTQALRTYRRIGAAGSPNAGIAGSAQINHSGVRPAGIPRPCGFRRPRCRQTRRTRRPSGPISVAGSLLGRCVRRRVRGRRVS